MKPVAAVASRQKPKAPGAGQVFADGFLYFCDIIWNRLLTSTAKLDSFAFEEARNIFRDQWYLRHYGLLGRGMMCGVTAYFFTYCFLYLTQNSKLVPDDSGNCLNVPRKWTSNPNADFFGFWEGESTFQPNYRIYDFKLLDFKVSNGHEYSAWINEFDTALKNMGSAAVSRNLASNLLYWHSWSYMVTTTSPFGQGSVKQTLLLDADAAVIMNKDVYQGTFANIAYDCPIGETFESYHQPTAHMVMTFPSVNAIMSNPSCNLLNLPLLGWNAARFGDTFKLKVDVRALFTALAIANSVSGRDTFSNYNIIRTLAEGKYNGIVYSVVDISDSLYPMMSPVTCLGPKAAAYSNWNCIIRIGDTFGVPIMNHAGVSSTNPEPCDCSSSLGQSAACDSFNLFAGLLIFDHTQNQTAATSVPSALLPFLPFLELFYTTPLRSVRDINANAFQAAFAANLGAGDSAYKNSQWRSRAYKFATTKSFSGVLVVFQVSSSTDYSITPSKYQLTNGACSDSFSSPYFSRLATVSWGPLDEALYSCKMSLVPALGKAIGVGLSAATFVVPYGILTVMWCSLALLAMCSERKKRVKPPKELLQEASKAARLLAGMKIMKVLLKPHRISLEDREELLRLRTILGMTTSGVDAGEFLHDWGEYRAKALAIEKAADEEFFDDEALKALSEYNNLESGRRASDSARGGGAAALGGAIPAGKPGGNATIDLAANDRVNTSALGVSTDEAVNQPWYTFYNEAFSGVLPPLEDFEWTLGGLISGLTQAVVDEEGIAEEVYDEAYEEVEEEFSELLILMNLWRDRAAKKLADFQTGMTEFQTNQLNELKALNQQVSIKFAERSEQLAALQKSTLVKMGISHMTLQRKTLADYYMLGADAEAAKAEEEINELATEIEREIRAEKESQKKFRAMLRKNRDTSLKKLKRAYARRKIDIDEYEDGSVDIIIEFLQKSKFSRRSAF